MKKMFFAVFFIVFALFLFAQTDEAKSDIKPPSEDLANLQLANNLARYGYAAESPSALIGAAEIMIRVQTQALKAEIERSQGAQAQAVEQEYNPAALLADAKKLAKGNSTMISWANDVEKALNSRTRGAVGGPKEGCDIARGGESIKFLIDFRANQLAEVLVIGNGATVLDIFVYDKNGKLVARTDVYTADAYINWVPGYTGTYQVVVKNTGSFNNLFGILTN